MLDDLTKLYADVAYSVDAIIGKDKLIDGNFTGYTPDPLLSDPQAVFQSIDKFKRLNETSENIFPYFKRDLLAAEIDAIELLLKIHLNPEDYKDSYLSIVQKLLGTDTPVPSVDDIYIIHQQIDELLKQRYSGDSLLERFKNWKDTHNCTATAYLDIVQKLSKDYFEISAQTILPYLLDPSAIQFLKDHSVTNYEIIDTSENWAAYNYYRTDYRGDIAFNNAVTFNLDSAPHFVAHEGFPGHQMSGLIHEYYAKNILNDLYFGIKTINTPCCLIEEGIADSGAQLMGLAADTVDEKLNVLSKELSSNVSYLIAYKLFVDGISEDEALALIKALRLSDNEKDALRTLNFIKSWKYYVPSYKLGREFVSTAYRNSTDKKRFFQLIYLCPNAALIRKHLL